MATVGQVDGACAERRLAQPRLPAAWPDCSAEWRNGFDSVVK